MALPRDAVDLSTMCECSNALSYSPYFLFALRSVIECFYLIRQELGIHNALFALRSVIECYA